MLFGSIEAGGTKFVCAIGDENYNIKDSIHIPTTTPEETIGKCVEYFKKFDDIKAIGIASFGPIEVRIDNPKYGYITDTPKKNWSNTNFLGTMKKYFDIPMYWTTDVNGSAYGEYITSIKNHKPIHSLVYYTIGTGVGAGIVDNGHFLGHVGHPEAGHVRLKRAEGDKDFKGICPYHGDCLEGLASGPTFNARTGKNGKDVPLSDPAWDYIAYYVAQAAVQATLFVRPEKIIFGGGVVSEPFLQMVRKHFKQIFNDYLAVDDLNEYIQMPHVPHNGSATVGNFSLALKQYYKENIVKI
ncbi:ROK family protein [Apilactobacillus micheneri]|uniref:ROK family protein n=1 Tax=Apilactobacillus TaxID=2767877 RepID=UPI001129F634|nr:MULTISPECIES: ROK family protein [Apilactobacillus]TPR19509.1 ROK family protein [Apilactobacillus timberlakei]TPR20486.1 ROK family protein [Apilactobacillus timberlakei]TPR22530.1 ROK family protein [Apilactobacillus timberlakei]TPR23330.1 ROK family protein [Apilactobacillus timberlakei]TPR43888.1 ROK family protein [Apilactobacillus micheneri]